MKNMKRMDNKLCVQKFIKNSFSTNVNTHATNIKLFFFLDGGEQWWCWRQFEYDPESSAFCPWAAKAYWKTPQTFGREERENKRQNIHFQTYRNSSTVLFYCLLYIIFWIVTCREISCQCNHTEYFPLFWWRMKWWPRDLV